MTTHSLTHTISHTTHYDYTYTHTMTTHSLTHTITHTTHTYIYANGTQAMTNDMDVWNMLIRIVGSSYLPDYMNYSTHY